MDQNVIQIDSARHAVFKVTKICFQLEPPMINSKGIMEDKRSGADFLKYSLPLLELQIAIICLLCHGLHFVLKPIGITMFVSQILAGIILGPTFLGRFEYMKEIIFPTDSQEVISAAAFAGFQIYLFLSAVKLDLGRILNKGKLVMYSGVGSVMAPLILGFGLILLNLKEIREKNLLNEITNVTVIQSLPTLSIIANVLDGLNLLNSEIGRLALSSALISGILGIFILFITATTTRSSISEVLVDGLAVHFVLLLVAFALRRALFWVIRKTPQGSHISSSIIFIIIMLVFGSQLLLQLFNQVSCVGPIVLGLAVPAGPPLGTALLDKFELFVEGVLMPIAVTTSVMRADFSLIVSEFSRVKLYFVLATLGFASKFLATLIPSLFLKMPLNDSLIFAAIMTCRGLIELALYSFARDAMTIAEEVFAALVLCVLFSAMLVAIVVKCFYNPSRKYAGYQARNIMSLKPSSEFRILAWIHRPENVPSFISLLGAFNPHKQRPINVNVLHLIKLIGQFTPVLMAHRKNKPTSNSISQNVIISFNKFQQNNWGAASVATFTAISPPKLMNEDISIFALDKDVSLILLPFHRKWNIHGSIEVEDSNLRTINCRILEKAPSSVGIFLDRGRVGLRTQLTTSPQPLSICMIFLGGSDDREALSLAKRMVRDSITATLAVIHFIPDQDDVKAADSEDKKMDSLVLDEIKRRIDNDGWASSLAYKKKVVKGGPNATSIIRSIIDEYDLFIVGRRHGIECPQTSGLSDWAEFPELGVIGDLLVSTDVSTRAAVLVVQQQKQM